MQKRIDFFGNFRPTGVDPTAGAQFRALAGLGGQIADTAIQFGRQAASAEGQKQAFADVQAGQVPKEKSGFTAYGQAYNKAATLAYRADVRRQTKLKLTELSETYKNDPEAFKQVSESYLQGTTQGLSPEMGFVIGDDIQNSITDTYTSLRSDFAQREERKNIASVAASLDDITDDIQNAAREGKTNLLAKYEAERKAIIQDGIDAGLVDPVKAAQQDEILREQIEVNSIVGGLDRIFSSELGDVEKVTQGQAYIQEKLKDLPDLNPNQKDSLKSSLNASLAEQVRKSQERSLEEEQQIALKTNDLILSAENGTRPAADIVTDAHTMFMNGELSEKELLSVQQKVIARQQKGFDQAQSFEMVAKRLQGDDSILLSPTQVNDYYEKKIIPMTQDLSSIERSTIAANYAIQTGIVPTKLKQQITNGIVSQNPDLITESVDIVNRLDEIPGIDLGLSKTQEAFAFVAAELIDVVGPERAIELAQKQTDPRDKARIEAKKQEIKDEEYEDDYLSDIESEFDEFGAPDVDEGNKYIMEQEFKTAFEANFIAGMEESKARERAFKDMKRNWKYSPSTDRWMKYAPEDYYASAQGSEYIGKQLSSYVNKNFVGQKAEKIMLISDEETGRMVRAGIKPDYIVQYLDENGEVQVLSRIDPTDDKRKRVRWSPDLDKENERIRKVNQGLIQDVTTKTELESASEAINSMRGF